MENNQKATSVCGDNREGFVFVFSITGDEKICQSQTKALQAEWSIPPVHKNTAFRENFALSAHHVKISLNEGLGLSDVSTITSVPPSELAPNDPLHRHVIMFRCRASPSTVMFLFHSYRAAKSHDCNKAKEHQMQWNLLYVSKTPLAWPELLFLHSGNLCKYYLLFRRKCSYNYQLYTYIYLLFTARLMGTYFTYCGGRKKKKPKTKCTKKCFPCKHGNPPCCLLLLYLKTCSTT